MALMENVLDGTSYQMKYLPNKNDILKMKNIKPRKTLIVWVKDE